MRRADKLTTFMTLLKSGGLNLVEPPGAVQACNGIALLLPLPFTYQWVHAVAEVV